VRLGVGVRKDGSGFIRMIWGYRAGLPLRHLPDGVGIPRRSFQILDSAPGVITMPNTGQQITDFSKLSVGDIVFFDASTDDGTRIDHMGMFIGRDSGGYHRFISSRKSVNGPTLGDFGGRSILETINGGGTYAKTFRAVRRF
jgi:cell wall-associated NlpC family hydrolase